MFLNGSNIDTYLLVAMKYYYGPLLVKLNKKTHF